MYVPPAHRFDDREALFALVEAHPLGAWVCHADGELIANHLPFFLDRSGGPSGTLIGHVSRANPVWRRLGDGLPSVVMFRGPQAYVSPGWYPGTSAHGRVVPTWNYVVAHAHGSARAVHGRDRLLAMLNRLTDFHEARRPSAWRVADAPAAFIERMAEAVVGIEIPIARLEGKLKMSQDEAPEDRAGTVEGLRAEPGDEGRRVADLVQAALDAHAKPRR